MSFSWKCRMTKPAQQNDGAVVVQHLIWFKCFQMKHSGPREKILLLCGFIFAFKLLHLFSPFFLVFHFALCSHAKYLHENFINLCTGTNVNYY